MTQFLKIVRIAPKDNAIFVRPSEFRVRSGFYVFYLGLDLLYYHENYNFSNNKDTDKTCFTASLIR